MTMTGDWTVVKDGNNNNNNNNDDDDTGIVTIQPSAPTEGDVPMNGNNNSSSNNSNTAARAQPQRAAVRFPCSEQPPRFALRARRHGYYLGGTKKGRLVGRKKRSENDEWTIAYSASASSGSPPASDPDPNATTTDAEDNPSRLVTIHNFRFNNILSLVDAPKTDLGRIAACVKQPSGILGDLGLGEEEEDNNNNNNNNNNAAGTASAPLEQLPGDEDDNDDDDDEGIGNIYDKDVVLPLSANKEDLRWSVESCSGADHPNGGVTIVSDKTGDYLGVTDRGRIVLCSSNTPVPLGVSHVWEMECVTGELCFLSNPSVDARVRCDMTGLLTLSPNWKGWEVVRITEASPPHTGGTRNTAGGGGGGGAATGRHGYVRISSWMHSQWFMCSDSEGIVSSCSVSESLAPPPPSKELASLNNYRCSRWAIEKYPADEDSKHRGVILRSVTHGRLLSIRDGVPRTYDSMEAVRGANNNNNNDADDAGRNIETEATPAPTAAASSSSDPNIGDVVKQHTEEVLRNVEQMKRKSNEWWKQSVTNVQKAVSDSAMKRRNSKNPFDFLNKGGNGNANANDSLMEAAAVVAAEEETIVWQLEAAHQQTYYFLSTTPKPSSSVEDDNNGNGNGDSSVQRSIGTFPSVTDNLRKSDKIQMIRNDEDPDSLKLYLPDEQFFVSCSSRGVISATKSGEDEGTEWTLQDTPGGSVFRSKQHGLYLSYVEEGVSDGDNNNNNNDVNNRAPPAAAFETNVTGGDVEASSPSGTPTKKNPFQNLQNMIPQKKKIPMAELCGTPTPQNSIWKLEPCTPRAISSKRLKTFAIGTSIAVGTTIAMPFALAGVAAAMGAMGAEAGIGFGIVAAGLTGAEALASVGAIGATAYFCFRPEQNSLGGPTETNGGGDGGANGNPWSKRPFSNWRNW